MNTKFSILAIFTFVLSARGAIPSYTPSLLPGALGSNQSMAMGISSTEVVGSSSIGGSYSAVVWQNGQAFVLPAPLGYQGSAMAVSNNGGVAGGVRAPGDQYPQPALWVHGQLQLLNTPPGFGGMAYDVNDGNIVVGTVTDAQTTTFQAVMWSDGQLAILGDFPDEQANAVAINNSNHVLISAGPATWVWVGGSLTNVPSLGGTAVVGRDINNAGTVVGELTITNGTALTSGFIYQNGVSELLPALMGDSFTNARAINDSGVIIGDGYSDAGGLHAVMWQDGQVFKLNDLIPADSGWELVDALDISNDGVIVGYGVYNGQISAFALTPTAFPSGTPPAPEPATAVTLALAAPLLLRGRRRSD